MLNELNIDLWPAYVPFERQATKADGTKINPTVATVRIFTETGADGAFDNSEIAGSPFTCAIINAKVGNYGILIDKTLLVAGNIYRVLYEWTVDAITTATEETYLVVNSSSFKADVTEVTLRAQESTFNNCVTFDSVLGAGGIAYPLGTPLHPVNDEANAKTIAGNNNLHCIFIEGSWATPAAMEHYNFFGHGHVDVSDLFDLNTQDVDHSSFYKLTITGTQGGGATFADCIRVEDCLLYQVASLNGVIKNGGVGNSLSLKNGGVTLFTDVKFGVFSDTTITVNTPGSCDFNEVYGKFTLATMGGGTVNIRSNNGCSVIISGTCTGGTINVYGNVTLTDNNGGTTVNRYDTINAITNSTVITHEAFSGTAVTGGVIAGTYASTAVQDNAYWQIECRNNDDAAALLVELDINIGVGRSPVAVVIHGRIESDTGKDVDIYAWNYDIYDWEKISNDATQMKHNTNNKGYQYALSFRHHDYYVASHGDMIIRFVGQGIGFTAADNLYIDEVLVSTVLEGSGDQPDLTSHAVWGYNIDTVYPSGGGDAGADVADIKANSVLIDAKTTNLPADPASETNVDANETKIDAIKVDTAATLIDTNEMQGKLPANYIMGSADGTNKSDDIDNILIDTMDIGAKVNNVTYGLAALQTLLDAIDTSTELAAKFTEIKGAGWTDETLKAIKIAIDAAVTLNDITTRGR